MKYDQAGFLTVERLKALMDYDPGTGKFTRLSHNGSRHKAGEECGWLDNEGYRRIKVDGHKYQAHRLAWLYMTGEWPPELIDHIDRNRDNNIWANIRKATNSQNVFYSDSLKLGKLGVRGICRRGNKFVARIGVNNNRINLGSFDTLDAAEMAYKKAAIEQFGEFVG